MGWDEVGWEGRGKECGTHRIAKHVSMSSGPAPRGKDTGGRMANGDGVPAMSPVCLLSPAFLSRLRVDEMSPSESAPLGFAGSRERGKMTGRRESSDRYAKGNGG